MGNNSTDVSAYSSSDNKTIIIPFDKVFNNEVLTVMNEFPINKKRNFIQLNKDILEVLNYVFDCDPSKNHSMMLKYLEMKNYIYDFYIKGEELAQETFINEFFKRLADDKILLQIVGDYIDSSYKIELDKISGHNTTNLNKELQFTDNHAKIILKVSTMCKYTIPIILQYVALFNVKNIDDLLFNVFSKYFDLFVLDNTNILNKLFKLVESRITTTNYSDRVIWLYLQNIGMTPELLSRSLNKKIISNIIPKIKNNTNVISFLHVVIKNSIRYQFTYNFPMSFKALNLNKADSEGLTDFDRLEVNMVRSDESLNIINDLTIKNIINSFKEKYSIKITKKERKYYEKNIEINNIQINFLFLFFSKFTKNYRLLYNCNFKTYIKILMIFEKWLRLHNFNLLADYIVALPVKITEKNFSNKKQILNKIIFFNKYDYLLENKYKLIQNLTVDKSLIVRLIGNLKYNKFQKINQYPVYKECGEYCTGMVIEPSDEILISEVLSFVEIV